MIGVEEHKSLHFFKFRSYQTFREFWRKLLRVYDEKLQVSTSLSESHLKAAMQQNKFKKYISWLGFSYLWASGLSIGTFGPQKRILHEKLPVYPSL